MEINYSDIDQPTLDVYIKGFLLTQIESESILKFHSKVYLRDDD